MSKHTPGPWLAAYMPHSESGPRLSPDEVAEYVRNAIRWPECDNQKHRRSGTVK